MAVSAGGAQVGADVEEGLGAAVGAPAAADLLLEFDHADVAFGLVVVERDPEVGGEPEHVGAVGFQAGEQGPGWAQCWAPAASGPGWWRVEGFALGDQGVVARGGGGRSSDRETGGSGGLDGLDCDVQFYEQLGERDRPRLTGEVRDPGQLLGAGGTCRPSRSVAGVWSRYAVEALGWVVRRFPSRPPSPPYCVRTKTPIPGSTKAMFV